MNGTALRAHLEGAPLLLDRITPPESLPFTVTPTHHPRRGRHMVHPFAPSPPTPPLGSGGTAQRGAPRRRAQSGQARRGPGRAGGMAGGGPGRGRLPPPSPGGLETFPADTYCLIPGAGGGPQRRPAEHRPVRKASARPSGGVPPLAGRSALPRSDDGCGRVVTTTAARR